jgi:hypothetical protein
MGIEHAFAHRYEFDSIAGLDGRDESAGRGERNCHCHDSGHKPILLLSPSMALTIGKKSLDHAALMILGSSVLSLVEEKNNEND